MKKTLQFSIQTNGEKLYEISNLVSDTLSGLLGPTQNSGILVIFTPHTSCGLCISEAFAPSAKQDVASFLQQIAPRNANFITHKDEGPDDSPSHMKSILLNSSLSLIVENRKLLLGQWQGIFLAEFRDQARTREIYLKFISD